MDPPHDTFEKVAGSGQWVDAYLDSTFQVFFKAGGDIVEPVELSSCEHFRVTLDGLSVFQTPADELISQINEHAEFDPDDPELGYSYCFPDLDMWLWRPVQPEHESDEGSYFETVGIGLSRNS